MDFPARLKAYANLTEARLSLLLPPVEERPFELHSAMRYSCLAPGKRLRPALCLAASEAVGGPIESALNGACAVEMVHCFSLIHDDLPAIDNDDLRRGLPTCHVKFGEAVAILAGDSLFGLAFESILQSEGASAQIRDATRWLARASGSRGLAGGETVDILSEGKVVDADTLEYIHIHKTAALIQASTAIGGLLGGGSAEQVEHLAIYGRSVGLAFQIWDDVLNEISTAEQLGKAAGSDRERGKATYPGIHGLDAAKHMASQLVDAAIQHLESFDGDTTFLVAAAKFSIERVK